MTMRKDAKHPNKIRNFFCPPFRPMIELVPETREGDYEIYHHALDEEFVKLQQIRSIFSFSAGESRYLEATTYCELRRHWNVTSSDGEVYEHSKVIMSDTPMERMTNSDFIRASKGDVLIAGLGMGMVLWPLINKEEVKSITVIEITPEIIKMIEPIFTPLAEEKGKELEIICDDIFCWPIPKGAMWDTIYFDIWDDVCGDHYDGMKTLHSRFSRRRPVGGWVGSWRKSDMRDHATGHGWKDSYKEGFKKERATA